MVNFPTQIPYCDSHSPALLDLFISSDASICSTMAFPSLGNSDHAIHPLFNSPEVLSSAPDNAKLFDKIFF